MLKAFGKNDWHARKIARPSIAPPSGLIRRRSRALPGRARLEIKLTLERQLFNEPLDDYWEGGPQLSFAKTYGHKSEFAMSYTYDHRTYDERQRYNLDSSSIPGTHLRFDQHEFEGALHHADRRVAGGLGDFPLAEQFGCVVGIRVPREGEHRHGCANPETYAADHPFLPRFFVTSIRCNF